METSAFRCVMDYKSTANFAQHNMTKKIVFPRSLMDCKSMLYSGVMHSHPKREKQHRTSHCHWKGVMINFLPSLNTRRARCSGLHIDVILYCKHKNLPHCRRVINYENNNQFEFLFPLWGGANQLHSFFSLHSRYRAYALMSNKPKIWVIRLL